METFAASKENFMDTASPGLPLSELKSSMQACSAELTVTEVSEGPANSGNPHIYTVIQASAKKKKKKKKMMMIKTRLPVCRAEGRQLVNTSRRLEKFCKHRNGLFKKARELSNLCNAEVAAIVVSPSGTVSEFASSSMHHILKKYQSFQPQMRSSNVLLHGAKRWKREIILQHSGLKDLQELKRFSENVPSSIDVVQNFESMLTYKLDEIRKRKMELFEVEIQKIVEQGEILFKESALLEEKLTQKLSAKECLSGSEESYCE